MNISTIERCCKRYEDCIKLCKLQIQDYTLKLKTLRQKLEQFKKEVHLSNKQNKLFFRLFNKRKIVNSGSSFRLKLAKQLLHAEGIKYYCDKKKKVYSLKPIYNYSFGNYTSKRTKNKIFKALSTVADNTKAFKHYRSKALFYRYHFNRED